MMHLQHVEEGKNSTWIFPLKHFILDVYDKAVVCGKNSRYIEYIKYITPSVNIQSASWFLDTKSTELSEVSEAFFWPSQ